MWWAWLQVSPDWKCSSSTCRPCTWVCPGHGYSEEDWRWSSDGVATQVCILSWSARSFESERSSEWQHLIFFTWPNSLVWLKNSSPLWFSRWKVARTGQHSFICGSRMEGNLGSLIWQIIVRRKKIWQFLMSVVHIVSFIWFAVVSCIIHCTNLSEYRFPFRVFLFKRMYILYKARYIRGTKCCASLYLAVSEHEYRN